jgi:recombination protein RecR
VLGGALSPLDAIGPDDIRIDKLIKRLKSDSISEVIIATDADSKGEITAVYLADIIKILGIKVTRLGYGLPVGGDIEYADELTISRAIAGRKEM